MSTPLHSYNGDIVAWANERARLLREGQFSQLDIEHIAEEIEDVGKSEQREREPHGGVAGSSAEMATPARKARQ